VFTRACLRTYPESNESISHPQSPPIYVELFPMGCLLQVFWQQIVYSPLFTIMHVTCSAHRTLHNIIALVLFGEKYNLRRSSSYNCLYNSVSVSLSDPNILLSVIFSIALNLCWFLWVIFQVSQTYMMTEKSYIFFVF
jgi:uncharacterized membrane protein YbjE (DUF340 family)